MNLLPLDLLAAGESAEIVEVTGAPEEIHRLAEMGIRQGAVVRMVQPGCPCILTVDDRRFTLRLDTSVTVMVEMGAVA